jgi:hypothetical protein
VQISAEIYIYLLTYYFDNNNIIETEKEHQLLNAVENHSGLMNTLRSQFRANIHKYADISQWIRDISGNNFYTVLRIFWVISQLVNKLNSMNFIEYSLKRGVLDHSQVEDLVKRGVLDYSTVHEYYNDWVKLEKILGDTFKGINEEYLKYVEEYRKNFKDSLKELYDIEGYLRNKYFREISKIERSVTLYQSALLFKERRLQLANNKTIAGTFSKNVLPNSSILWTNLMNIELLKESLQRL